MKQLKRTKVVCAALALPLCAAFFACGSVRPVSQVNPYYYSSYPPRSRSHVYIGGFSVYLKRGVGAESLTPAERDECVRVVAERTAAIEEGPALAASYNERGVAYNKLNRLDESLADFNRAIAADPSFTDAYYNRGVAFLQRGENDAALADLQKVFALYPANRDVQYYLAVSYYETGDKKNALKLFTAVHASDPGYLDAAHYLDALKGV